MLNDTIEWHDQGDLEVEIFSMVCQPQGGDTICVYLEPLGVVRKPLGFVVYFAAAERPQLVKQLW